MALVLTYDSPENLILTLDAVASQTTLPAEILVVDNGGWIKAERTLEEWPPGSSLCLRVVREEINSGPGGGWAAALKLFRDSDHSFAWLLDDDIIAPPNCLERMLHESERSNVPELIIPSVLQPNGAVTTYPAWHSVLIDHKIVDSVGLPRADFFWWAEDTEYLMWRIPNAGYPIRYLKDVIVAHNKGRGEWGNPPWKYYYEARNSIYYHFHLRHGRGRWPRKMALLLLRLAFRETDHRATRLWMIARGVADGVLGRLGRRIDPMQFQGAPTPRRDSV